MKARAHGTTTLCVSGCKWSKKPRGEVKGSTLEVCVEKGSELRKGNPLRKFKGRAVFQGNSVKGENAEQALLAELGSAPSTMEAAKAIDAYGAMPGNCTQQSDGRQAYTQALHKGIKTWVRPKGWASKFSDPAVQLILAPYVHPDSGCLWEKHCEDILFLVFILYSLEPGLQFSGIPSFGSCSQCTSTTLRCQVRFRTLQKGENLFLPKSTWIHLRQLAGTLDVNTLSRTRFVFHKNIILSLMFSIMTWRIHPTKQRLRLVELRISGNTIQNMAWLFVNTSSPGASFAARLTVLPRRLGWAGRGRLSANHASTKMVLLNFIGISMRSMNKFKLFLSMGWNHLFLS